MARVRRVLLSAGAAFVVVAATAQPVHAQAPLVNLSPTKWAWTDSGNPSTSYLNQSGDMPVGTSLDAAGKAHTRRSYFTFDLTGFKGQAIHVAGLTSTETSVTDCTATAPVEIWRTSAIKDNTAWNRAPQEIERIAEASLGTAYGSCPSGLWFELAEAVGVAVARGDKTLTIELRVAAVAESDQRLGRTVRQPRLAVGANHLAVASELKLQYPEGTCGTVAKHPTAGSSPTFSAKVTDGDVGDPKTLIFAVWDVDHPDQRREFMGGTYGGGVYQASTDLSGYADGTLIAWSARGFDYTDYGPWAKACYLTVDKTPPAHEPGVASKQYPAGTVGTGGPGVLGRFRFDAGGNPDVAAFAWRDTLGRYGTVKANRSGGAVLEYTPDTARTMSLYVVAVDAAGNRGPEKEYQFTVRATSPYGSVDMAGVGLPSTINLTATASETTVMSYQLPESAEVKLPVTGGKASGSITFNQTGSAEITLRAYKGTKLLGQNKLWTVVSDQPVVESVEFDLFANQVEGKTGSFTFKPRRSGVVAYQYVIGGRTAQVDAAADGSAVLPYTADTPGFISMQVSSVSADGTVSQATQHYFSIVPVRPSVYVWNLTDSPRTDGVGILQRIEFGSQLPDLTGFVYRYDGGPETSLSSNGNSYAYLDVTPTHAGDTTVIVQAVRADGSRSPETRYTFQVFSGPVVTWTPADEVIANFPVTVTFRAALPGATQFRYTLPYGDQELTVPVGADGTATVTYTPLSPGLDTLLVRSVAADGTESEQRYQYIYVRDDRVTVYAPWNEYNPTGGVGIPGTVGFYSQFAPNIVEFRYHVEDGPVVAVPPTPDSTTTYTDITPTHSGLNTLYVQQVLAGGGLSQVTEYRFLVGTATNVVSAQYLPSTWGGGVGVEGTFDFTAGADGVVAFGYQFDYDETKTVEAVNGHATVKWTPSEGGSHTLAVTGRRADGSTTDRTWQYLLVQY
ncbi:hypothetical protein ACFO1B_21285 [Dactylosporangium siamense]|uniref:DNRLRE domain-containing protein n=1 Tax=Dactylosporangium siamense TaxID=685454 RepID=A0A919PKZ4_9ACTN|nr:hypothetical protein [Dactylosporangium siamense]GIG46725.1 hypothetical protein Dsi01nite_047660 [Dactylosporangium siamense]